MDQRIDSVTYQEALARFVDGEPEPGDDEILSGGIERDPQKKEELVRLLYLDEQLRQIHLEDETSFVHSFDLLTSGGDEQDSFIGHVEQLLDQPGKSSWSARSTSWYVAGVACLIAVTSLAYAALIHVQQQFRVAEHWGLPTTGQTERNPFAPDSMPDAFSSSEVLAVLVNEFNARFSDAHAPDKVAFGEGVYHLLEGAAHLRFRNGADVVIQSGTRLEIRSSLNVLLMQGRLTALVPDSARGFTVRANETSFEDLGTEFGVFVDPKQARAECHVFQGIVKVRSDDQVSPREVVTGEAVSVQDGKVESIEIDTGKEFVSMEQMAFVRWQRQSEAIKKDRSLICYFPFEQTSESERVLMDTARFGPLVNGSIVGAKWVSGRWQQKQALLFDQPGDRVELHLPASDERQLTLAVWLKLDRVQYALNAIFNSDGWESGDMHWQLDSQQRVFFSIFGVPRGKWESDFPIQFPVGQWTHLAVTVDYDTGFFSEYLNGNLIRMVRIPSSAPPVHLATCRIGSFYPGDKSDAPVRDFRGRIDEFALWRRALKPDEISRLVLAGRPVVEGVRVAWQSERPDGDTVRSDSLARH